MPVNHDATATISNMLKGMEAVLKLIESEKFNMKDMITNVYSLDEVDKGYLAIKNKPEGFIKSVITFD
jgi:threonine dehydrogenase-like Zn-dependent dehydrogenase